jgi:serine/threonine protein kinase
VARHFNIYDGNRVGIRLKGGNKMKISGKYGGTARPQVVAVPAHGSVVSPPCNVVDFVDDSAGCVCGWVQEMIKEAEMLASLKHPCIITFYGVMTGDCPMAAIEYMPGGSLKSALQKLHGKVS